jgi:hypothetical protein
MTTNRTPTVKLATRHRAANQKNRPSNNPSMSQYLLPTWWERYPPSIHWDNTAHETARLGGMPITAAVFDRIPDHDAYVPYYLYLCTWPSVIHSYRATSRARRLHVRAVLDALLRSPTNLPSRIQPLLELGPIYVWEEFLGIVRNDRYIKTDGNEVVILRTLATALLRDVTAILDPSLRQTHTEWVTSTLIPFHAVGETAADATHRRTRFTRLWTTIFLPILDDTVAAIYAKARQRCAIFRDELLATTWNYPYCLRFCVNRDEIASRWT